MNKTVASILLGILITSKALAEITYTPPKATGSGETIPNITISGLITGVDASKFRELVPIAENDAKTKNLLGQKFYSVTLNSNGGSVQAAMEIGKELRNSGAAAIVSPKDKCISACVLILAGAKMRLTTGRVGIHRPYLAEDSVDTIQGQEAAYKRTESQIKNYLGAMNVPQSLYDTMFRIPPEKVRFLTAKELQEFNLNENDPFYDSAVTTKEAQTWGMSKAQYIQFKAERVKCDKLGYPKDIYCWDQIAKKIRGDTR
jgi:ATP-dependent protease ClpP protease subunit